MTEAIRIAVLNFVHETVTFLPNDTALDDFVHDGSPALGTVRLEALPYRNVDISKFYPYGDVSFP
jgi:microcystin degradation protein MlrC